MKIDSKPQLVDFLLVSIFAAFITFQPYLFHHEIIMMETGVHLPALNALFHGETPFKDFIYWHGPLELYVPALMMEVFGVNSAVLPVFYYLFSVLTLIVALAIAREILRTKLIFYSFAIVLVARTFPRVAFYYWGGLRYCIGLLTVLFLIRGFKTKRTFWFLWAGAASCLSLLTTSEAGFCTVATIVIAVCVSGYLGTTDLNWSRRALLKYVFGGMLIGIPYICYLISTQSFIPFVDTNLSIALGFTKTFIDEAGNRPESFLEFFTALLPGSKFFKVMTPVYCYLTLFLLLLWRNKNKKTRMDWENNGLLAIGIYSLILYVAAFRAIWGHHFEMALQPEKIVYFFILEEIYFKAQKVDSILYPNSLKKHWAGVFVFIVLVSSLVFSSGRFWHRFVVFKWVGVKLKICKDKDYGLLAQQPKRELKVPRAQGMVVPVWQAEEIEGVVDFLQKNTAKAEPIFFYPEVGNFAFWADRPFVGRFPIATTSWVNEKWHEELVSDFIKAKPRYVVMTHVGHRTFPEAWYFRNPRNREHFDFVTDLIIKNYNLVKLFEAVGIYERKETHGW